MLEASACRAKGRYPARQLVMHPHELCSTFMQCYIHQCTRRKMRDSIYARSATTTHACTRELC
jgi:hypothetical protein